MFKMISTRVHEDDREPRRPFPVALTFLGALAVANIASTAAMLLTQI